MATENSDCESALSIEYFRRRAKDLVLPEGWEYYDDVSGDGWTYRDSIAAFDRYVIRPRIMRDVGKRRLTTTVLGESISMPICVSPTALHIYCHPDAEKESARAIREAGTLMVMSSSASTTIEDVAKVAPGGLRWMHTYIYKNRKHTEHIVKEAERMGFKAIVLSVDSPITVNYGDSGTYNRYDDGPGKNDPNYSCKNLDIDLPEVHAAKQSGDISLFTYTAEQHNSPITWEDFKWLKSITSLPIVCKGILTGEAACEAADAGASAILVSAHGGRQLDGVPAPIDVLSEVAAAVRGRNVEVYMDGGVRSGRDVFKALGRGAKAVFLGRPILWGLACNGGKGVKRVLTILRNELDDALALAGCTSPEDIPESMIVHKSYYESNSNKMNHNTTGKSLSKL